MWLKGLVLRVGLNLLPANDVDDVVCIKTRKAASQRECVQHVIPMSRKVDNTSRTTFVSFEIDRVCRAAITLFIPRLFANYDDTVGARFLQGHMNMVMSRLQDCLISMRIRVANDLSHSCDCQPANWHWFEHGQRNCTIHVDPDGVSHRRIDVRVVWQVHRRWCVSISQHAFDVDSENVATVNKVFRWRILPENGQIDGSLGGPIWCRKFARHLPGRISAQRKEGRAPR